MIEPLKRLVAGAERRLRLARALGDGCAAATWTLAAMAFAALIIELVAGLTTSILWVLATALAVPVGLAVRGALVAPGPVRSAKALDKGLLLFDRIGTALAFDGWTGGLVELQRADALARAGAVSPAAAIPLHLGTRIRGPLVALLVLVAVVGLCLRFNLRGEPRPPEPTALEVTGEDLLSVLAEVEEGAVARGDKRVLAAVTDLQRQVERIVEEERRRRVPEPDPEPEEAESEPPPPEELPEIAPSDDLISVAELEVLHEQLQMELAAATDFDLENVRRSARRAFQGSDAMKDVESEFDNELLPDVDMLDMASNADGGYDSVFGGTHNPLSTANDNAMSMEALQGQLDDAMQMARNDISADSMVADDRKHALQVLMNQFLEEYVAERGEQMADWLAGKREHTPKVKVADDTAGSDIADKTDAMAEMGFEDVSDQGEDDGLFRDTGAPAADGVPEGADLKLLDEARDGAGPGGMAAEGMEGDTARGAQGAGRSSGDDGGGGEGGRDLYRSGSSAELEKILGQVTDDRMPPERRREVLEEIATRKVRGGFANDFDDVQQNYFEEAERLLVEEADELPPLFRDYAHEYFEAILTL